GQALTGGGADVHLAQAADPLLPTLEDAVEEPQRQIVERAAGELLAAGVGDDVDTGGEERRQGVAAVVSDEHALLAGALGQRLAPVAQALLEVEQDRKSTRLNSSHV